MTTAYDVWRGEGHPWARWVKPAPFAELEPIDDAKSRGGAYRKAEPPWAELDTSWAPPADSTALLVDLPGPRALHLGLALVRRGYRPIVSFNACSHTELVEVVEMSNVLATLSQAAGDRANFPRDEGSRPAFLFDARRDGAGAAVLPDMFDNRWLIFPSDLPSARLLLRHGIKRAAVVQGGPTPQPDLFDIAAAYKQGGLAVDLVDLSQPQPAARPLALEPGAAPERFVRHAGRWLGSMGRRRLDGSYGVRVPRPSQG
jgi:hypothetical protein